MKGIAIKRRQKKRARTWNGSCDSFFRTNLGTGKTEESVGKPGKKTSPKPSDSAKKGTRELNVATQEEEEKKAQTLQTMSAVMVMFPQLQKTTTPSSMRVEKDGPITKMIQPPRGAVCTRVPVTKIEKRRVAALPRSVCVVREKKQKIGFVSKLQVLGQTMGPIVNVRTRANMKICQYGVKCTNKDIPIRRYFNINKEILIENQFA